MKSISSDWNACPTADCPGGKIIHPGEGYYFHCGLCGFEKCLRCFENHQGSCEQSRSEHQETEKWMSFILDQGKLPAPENGHPKNTTHRLYYHGRFRPCYYCGLITERELDGSLTDGQCNSMVCQKCKKKWHWNYGDHSNHPEGEADYREIHDFTKQKQLYEPMRSPHL